MPARDRYHDHVRNALIKDGWTITDDPLRLRFGPKDLYVDLGAERLLAAQKGSRKIAVEVKTFLGLSEMANLEGAVGQYSVYLKVMTRVDAERELYLAISEETFTAVFEEPVGRLFVEDGDLKLLVFDPKQETIRKWIP